MQWQPHFPYRQLLSVVLCLLMFPSCTPGGDSPTLPTPPASPGLKKRLAVLDFTTRVETQGWREASAVAADMLTTSLFGTQQFVLVERREIEQFLTEQERPKWGEVDPRQAAKAGQILGAQALVLGMITQMGLQREGVEVLGRTVAEVAVDIRLVDTTTGEILHAVTGLGKEMIFGAKFPVPKMGITTFEQSPERDAFLSKALRKAFSDVAPKLVTQMSAVPWAARIVSVERDGTYLINAGVIQGLTPRKLLAVYRLGEMVLDPQTKKPLGFRKHLRGEGEVSGVETGYSIMMVKRGGPFQGNDIVQAAEGTP